VGECSSVDLVVAGGGPAGSTVSTLVARQGRRVLLLERERFPRHQIGESLLPITVHGVCALLGVLEELKAAGFVTKYGSIFRWGRNEEPWQFTFGAVADMERAGADYAFQVERSRFDQILLENARRAGVEVHEQCSVEELLVEDERVVGLRYKDEYGRSHTVRARFIVDASGHSSPLHHHVGERIYSEFFRNVALFCYFANAQRMPGILSGGVVSAAFREGWIWFIPLSDTLTSVGAVIAREHAGLLQQGHEQAMRGFVESCPLIKKLLSTATRVTDGQYGVYRVRSDYSYVNSRFWRPGLSLVGDAACFVDPVFSTGVHLATYSGLLAARSINTVLSGTLDETRCFTEFERRYRAEYENIYKFLIGFYDVHQDEESYFWRARKILNTSERANEAFVRLVSGLSTVEPDIFETGREISRRLRSFEQAPDGRLLQSINQMVRPNDRALGARIGASSDPSAERPRFGGGLIPTTDGCHWTIPTSG
jgi:halogenation protein CepH